MAIDVGSPCIDRGTDWSCNYTIIAAENPANTTGTIDHIDIWVLIGGSYIDVASFEQVSANTFTSRGSTGNLTTVLGDNDFDAPGDFTAFDINEGDYIGVHLSLNPKMEIDSSGDGLWYKSGDRIPCTDQLMSWLANYTISLYATGVEVGEDVTVYPSCLHLVGAVKTPIISGDALVELAKLALIATYHDPTIQVEGSVDITVELDCLKLGLTLKQPRVGDIDEEYIEIHIPIETWKEETKPSDEWNEETKPEDSWEEK